MRRIAVITGTRAEYGILEPVLDAIDAHDGLELKLVVTGTHLTTDSIRDIRRPIAARVRMQQLDKKVDKKGSGVFLNRKTPDPFNAAFNAGRGADVQALGRGVSGLGKALAKLSPEVVLVIGDRIEALAGALAGQVGGYRVAHIHGGDRAEGVADEAMRHAISKLAHLHLAATAQSRRRLIRMGEHADQVFNTGSPAVDALADVVPATDAPEIIVMQHPVGEADETERRWMDATLKATAKYSRLVCVPNHDPGRASIMKAIKDHGIKPVDHLPRQRFLSLLAGARALVGNSSAGLIEAAAIRTPAVNLGPRQGGRQRPRSVIDAAYGITSTRNAIRTALKLNTKRIRHPYGNGQAGLRIADLLATRDLDTIPLRKCNAY